MNQLILFDYQELDAETRIVVQQRTSEIKALMKRTAQDIVEIGEKLTDVRNRLVGNGNGGFEGWLRLEFDWGKTTAYRFINVAESFGRSNLERLDFAPSALYLLSSPSTPDDARREAIERAEAGERITHSAAKVIIEEYKPAPPVLEHSVPAPMLEFKHQELLRPVEELEEAGGPAWTYDTGTQHGCFLCDRAPGSGVYHWLDYHLCWWCYRNNQGALASHKTAESLIDGLRRLDQLRVRPAQPDDTPTEGLKYWTRVEPDDTPAWLQDDDAGEDAPLDPNAAMDRLAADLAAYTPAVGDTEMMIPAYGMTEDDPGETPDEETLKLIEEVDRETEQAPTVAANVDQPTVELSSSAPALPVPPAPAPAAPPAPPPPPVVRAAPWVASISVPEGDAPPLLTILHGSAPKSLLPESVARRMIAAIEARIEPAAVLEVPADVPVMAPDWLIKR